MSRPPAQQESIFGFLSVLEIAEYGFFGGYLLLNAFGRPLEFHCTAPVKPSRAQEILYGPTLQPYLLGEQIGSTLLGAARLQPALVLTDRAAMLCLRDALQMPLALVDRESTAGAPAVNLPVAGAVPAIHSSESRHEWKRLWMVGGHELFLPVGFEADGAIVAERLALLAEHIDLAEPFDRIHAAIREAQRIGERGEESYVQQAA